MAARRALAEVEDHGAPLGTMDDAGAGKAMTMTFGDFIAKRYGPHIEATMKAGSDTLAAIKVQFGHLDGTLLGSIARSDFDDFKVKRLNDGTHPSTVNRDMDRLKAALSQAVEWGQLTVADGCIAEGERNSRLFNLARGFVNKGFAPEVVLQRIQMVNATKCLVPLCAIETHIEQNQLLEVSNGTRLDTRAPSGAILSDTAVEAMGAVNRPTKRRRQGRG